MARGVMGPSNRCQLKEQGSLNKRGPAGRRPSRIQSSYLRWRHWRSQRVVSIPGPVTAWGSVADQVTSRGAPALRPGLGSRCGAQKCSGTGRRREGPGRSEADSPHGPVLWCPPEDAEGTRDDAGDGEGDELGLLRRTDGDVEGGLDPGERPASMSVGRETLFVPCQTFLRNPQKKSQRLVHGARVRKSLGHVRSQPDCDVLWLFPARSPSHHAEGTEIVLRPKLVVWLLRFLLHRLGALFWSLPGH